MTKITGETPRHAAGKCCWTEKGKLACLAPATTHFLLSVPPSDWCTWACPAHEDLARELFEVYDEHPADYTCLAAGGQRGVWIYSTPDRVGWCEPDVDETQELLERELVLTSSRPSDETSQEN